MSERVHIKNVGSNPVTALHVMLLPGHTREVFRSQAEQVIGWYPESLVIVEDDELKQAIEELVRLSAEDVVANEEVAEDVWVDATPFPVPGSQSPEQEESLSEPLPTSAESGLTAIQGIGRTTAEFLIDFGVYSIEDLAMITDEQVDEFAAEHSRIDIQAVAGWRKVAGARLEARDAIY